MTTPTPTDDERWIDVLAGRTEPGDDADTRHAAQARAYFVARAEAATAEAHAAGAESPRLKRLLNRLDAVAEQVRESERSLAPPQALIAANKRPQGLLARARAWLFPEQGGGLRLAGALAGVCAVMLVVWQVARTPDDDGSTMKSPPGRGASGPVITPPPATATLFVTSAQPEAAAADLRQALEALQAQVLVVSLGSQVQLDATVPAATQTEVQRLLATRNLSWTPAATLRVVFNPAS